MSIVIVGIGNADFSAMKLLDADDHGLRSSRGKHAQSDIVQFVPYRDFGGHDPARLAAAVYAPFAPRHLVLSTNALPPFSPFGPDSYYPSALSCPFFR